MPDIHPTAIVHSETELASDVSVGPYSVIGKGVRIGNGTRIMSHVVIEGPTVIGNRCTFFPFGSIGQIPQDLKFRGEHSELIIGDQNVFREFVTLHRGTSGGGAKTVVGNSNFFMAYAHVAHDCHIGNSIIMANGATLAGHVQIEDHSTIGAFSGIHQHCRVGKYGFIGGYSVITKDVLPYSKTVGNRAHCYGINAVGLRRIGFDSSKINGIRQAFRLLLQAHLNTSQAVDAIKKEVAGSEEVLYLLEFIRNSKRGIIK
ncbi:MAG TPA: acyl-ACP--UDP-N-acetylglucosamine O-acyltransferase [Acidobacteriota bacterium]|nr:acyl-ACP--UDP-N-acetylglucosamine O-acyltransferase [Acidobacteriota bacterium]